MFNAFWWIIVFDSGWWFGIFFIFPYIGNVIIPTDELIFFRGVGIPPTSICFSNFHWATRNTLLVFFFFLVMLPGSSEGRVGIPPTRKDLRVSSHYNCDMNFKNHQKLAMNYTLVNYHKYWKSTFWIGKSTINGVFSIANCLSLAEGTNQLNFSGSDQVIWWARLLFDTWGRPAGMWMVHG